MIRLDEKVRLICESAHDKKAEDIVVVEMNGRSALYDSFVVMSAVSSVRVKAIVEHIERRLKERGERVRHKEGEAEAVWVLLDCGDVVVHVFYHATRKHYDLEHLWGDAPRHNYLHSGV